MYSSQASAPRALASATAVVSEPPRPRNVTSWSTETPWAPPTTGTLPGLQGCAQAVRAHLDDLGLGVLAVWSRYPAWLPVKLSAGTPRSWRAMHNSAIALRSPAVTSMSISRPGRVRDTLLAMSIRSSVSWPMADTTTTGWSPRRCTRAM